MSSKASRVVPVAGAITVPRSLYITLQYLRTENGEHKFHWALHATSDVPPAGFVLHATDAGRQPLDLYLEVRPVRDPRRSQTLVVALKIADSPGIDVLDKAAATVRLMEPRSLPPSERRWTCRVWVKEVLTVLAKNRQIRLMSNLDEIERRCVTMANLHMDFKSEERIYNDLRWVAKDPSGPRLGSNYGSRFELPAERYFGPKPMVTDPKYVELPAGPYYGPKPMVTDKEPYYGPKPMDIGY
ncbi:hypothetical protein B0J18DRAFT_432604 [Chaetomium sp. MPI-SDFR-AT-0129]|nr:hypothetical protein B0J18DRAFT_432604 [Chaetomium sp. MPI-SDFR-AT-0129]